MYVANNKYVVLIEEIKTVVLDQVVHNEKKWDVVAIHYKDGNVTQMPYDTYDEAQKGFEQIAKYLLS
jgi:hypothetical protein